MPSSGHEQAAATYLWVLDSWNVALGNFLKVQQRLVYVERSIAQQSENSRMHDAGGEQILQGVE